MKIVNLTGGLGNQMFEYAFFLRLQQEHPSEEIKVCTRSYKGYGLHNGLELENIFKINLNEVSTLDLLRLSYPFFNYATWQVIRHILPKRKSMIFSTFDIPFSENEFLRKDSVYYDGYWQNENYFSSIRDIVLKTFSFPDFSDKKGKALSEILLCRNSVSCHVRRGDYLKDPTRCVCTPQYYKNAIKYMNEHVLPDLYCVFSDDIDWCKENLSGLFGQIEVIYVNWNHGVESYRDMQLMSLCKHNIIANSSFSWWGAWLNKNDNKLIISPEKWMSNPLQNDPICKSWKRIKLNKS